MARSAKYAISRWVVYKLVRANGATIRYKRLTPDQKRIIVDLNAAGVPQVEIAKRIHRSPSLVWHFLDKPWSNLVK